MLRAMKIAALLAGIALTLNIGVGLINLALTVSRMGTHLLPGYLAGQGMWFFSEACMIAFFFTFYARVKE
jgi:phage shock protein PspC (stress-responsive transcriptional regulator)